MYFLVPLAVLKTGIMTWDFQNIYFYPDERKICKALLGLQMQNSYAKASINPIIEVIFDKLIPSPEC